MKVYELTLRISSAYDEIEDIIRDDSLVEVIIEELVKASDGKSSDFSVELGDGGHVEKVYDSEDRKVDSHFRDKGGECEEE
ncbi:MAG: hypothetical protein MJZ81_10675 [Bacteroidales bacterium]|nr:hypothetical protein [Bacteroidales bacterium]